MSKHNVNPDHYKTAGREPQGRDVEHHVEKSQFAEERARERRQAQQEGLKNNQMPTSAGVQDDRPHGGSEAGAEAPTHGDEGGGGESEQD